VPHESLAVWSSNSQTVYYQAFDEEAHSSIWSVPAAGGKPNLLVTFDDPAQQLAAGAGRLSFTISHYQSDIFVLELRKER
jgi:hypothetical protein